MATYLQGVTDYIPEVQPFQPDLNFFNNALSTKQARYDAGYQQISQLYGTMLNSPLTHGENIQRRTDYFDRITSQIEKVSGLDLSKSENVSKASKIFDPLINDDYLIKDMSFTKSAHNSLNEAEYYRKCSDPKKCGNKYWEGGVRDIKYQMEDFANSDLQSTLEFSNPRYTPYRNVAKEAVEFAKEMGFSMENITMDPSGRYRIKTANGVAAIPHLTDMFMATIGNDQQAIDFFRVQGRLQRKDFVHQNAQLYGSAEKAEEIYIQQQLKEIPGINEQLLKEHEQKEATLKNTQAILTQATTSVNLDPNSPIDAPLINQAQQIPTDAEMLALAGNVIKDAAELLDPRVIVSGDLKSLAPRVDGAVANVLMNKELFAAARDYAMLTQKIDIKADEYALGAFEHANRISELAYKHSNDIDLAITKKALDLLGDQYQGLGMNPNEQVVADSATPGGTAPIESLFDNDFKIQASAQYIAEDSSIKYHESIVTQLNDIISKPDDFKLANGLLMSPEIRKHARAKLQEIYGIEQITQVGEVKDNGVLDYFKTGWEMTKSLFSSSDKQNEIIDNVAKKQTEGVKTYRNGYLDSSGKLIQLREAADYTDPNSQLNYRKLYDKAKSTIASDAILNDLLRPNSEISILQKETDRNMQTLRENEMRNGRNTVAANRITIQEYAQANPNLWPGTIRVLQNYATENGMLSKDMFIEMYKKENKDEIKQEYGPIGDFVKGRFPLFEAVASAAGLTGGNLKYSQEELAEQGAEQYEKYSEQFTKIFNRVPGQAAFKDYQPIVRGIKLTEGGATIQQNPFSYLNVDARYPGSEGFAGTRDTYMDVRNALGGRDGANMVKAVFGIGGGATGIDNSFEDLENVNNDLALKMMSRMMENAGSKTAKEKWDMKVHPVALNDENISAVTFTLKPEFADANTTQGNKVKDLDAGVNMFTIFMDKSIISETNAAFAPSKQGPMTAAFMLNRGLSLNTEFGGSVNILPNNTGGAYASGSFIVDDLNGGTVEVAIPTITIDPGAINQGQLEELGAQFNQKLNEFHQANMFNLYQKRLKK